MQVRVSESLKTLLRDSVETLQQDLDYRESTIVEVPGHEHDHHHHDHLGHDHNHSPAPRYHPGDDAGYTKRIEKPD